MAKKIVFEWEWIDKLSRRAKVIGGWLIITEAASNKGGVALTSTFIQDTDWQWQPIEPYVDPQVVKANLAKDFEIKEK